MVRVRPERPVRETPQKRPAAKRGHPGAAAPRSVALIILPGAGAHRRHAPRVTGTVGRADRICGDSTSGNRRRAEELSVAPDDVIRIYLHRSRDALIWKLDGLSEYDLRRPLTPTGTNLLGLIKHTAGVTADYLGAVFGRPSSGRCRGSARTPSRTPTCG